MDNLPRVLIVEPQNSGGMWHYAFSLTRALAHAGVTPILATIAPFEELRADGEIRISALGTWKPRTGLQRIIPWGRMTGHIEKLRRLNTLVTELRPWIVHLHNPLGKLDFLYFRLLKTRGVRVVYTAHDAAPLDGEENWFGRARYRAADAILVHSSRDVGVLVATGIDPSLITVIPLGNALLFCPESSLTAEQARSLLGLPAGSRTVLFFGTIAPYKGLDLLLQAFAKLSRLDPSVYLVIAGEPLGDFSTYHHLIEELGVMKRVILRLGNIPFEDFPKFFSAAEVVVYPYRRISQSGALQLAYAYGRPVVVTDVGGLGEAVAADHSGFVASTLDAEGLLEAIHRVLSDPSRAAQMGAEGRRMAETKYSWDAIARNVVQVYQSIHSTRRQGL